jgi:hypothetical protein
MRTTRTTREMCAELLVAGQPRSRVEIPAGRAIRQIEYDDSTGAWSFIARGIAEAGYDPRAWYSYRRPPDEYGTTPEWLP